MSERPYWELSRREQRALAPRRPQSEDLEVQERFFQEETRRAQQIRRDYEQARLGNPDLPFFRDSPDRPSSRSPRRLPRRSHRRSPSPSPNSERRNRPPPSEGPVHTGFRLRYIINLLNETRWVNPNDEEGIVLRTRFLRIFGTATLIAKDNAEVNASPDIIWESLVNELIASQLFESESQIITVWEIVMREENPRRMFDDIVGRDSEHAHSQTQARIFSLIA